MSVTILRKVSVSGGTVLRASNNLGDVGSAATARANLSVPSLTELANSTNPRAPRQGLVFDGTTGGEVSNVSAFGTSDFSIEFVVLPTAFAAAQTIVCGPSGTGPYLYLTAGGAVQIGKRDVGNNTASTGTLTANKVAHVVYSRSGTTGTYYINGVAAGTTTDNYNYSGAVAYIGKTDADTYPLAGRLLVRLRNRALTAAEVISLYELGTPAATDFNNASNTTMFGAANWVDAGGFTGFASSAADAFTASASSTASFAQQNSPLAVVKGRKYRFAITANAGAQQAFLNAGGNTEALTAQPLNATGGIVEITAAATGTSYLTVRFGAGFTSASAASLTPIGLVLAPEANAPGNGYQWKDMSGNRADILLPTSGVTWALPDRRPNSYRETQTWAADNTAKYLGSVNHTVPPGGVVRDVIAKSTANTTGDGFRLSTFNAGGFWVASVPLTANTKKVCTVANRVPGSAASDSNMAVRPDSVAFTGSITTEVFWDFAGDS